jgi:predicted MFS family arabinose efflux permease
MNRSTPMPSLRTTSLLFGLAFLGITLGQPGGIGTLPVSFLLKDRFHFAASGVALFFALVNAPFYLKPLAGLVSETWLSRIKQRKQIVVASLATIVCWEIAASASSSFPALGIGLFVTVLFIVFINTVAAGLMVEIGQKQHATGRFSAIRAVTEALGVIISGTLGGYLAGKPIAETAAVGALCFALVAWAASHIHFTQNGLRARPNLGSQFLRLIHTPTLGLISLILFLVLAAPGLQTTLLYFQTDILHFSPQFIGELTAVTGLAALAGAGLYAYSCRKVAVRKLLWVGIAGYLLATLSYLLYRSADTALAIGAANGLALALAGLPVLDLATRSCPPGLEAAAFGVILSVTDAATSLSDIGGSTLYSHYHVSFYALVWLNVLATIIAIPFVMRLPRAMTDRSDT